MKVLLNPGEYRFVAKTKNQTNYSIKREIMESKQPSIGSTWFFNTYKDTGYDCLVGDTSLSYQGVSANADAYDLKFSINGEQISYSKQPGEFWFTFVPSKVGTFVLRLETRNSADLTIPGAAIAFCEVTMRVTTNDNINTVRNRLENTLISATDFMDAFVINKTFGNSDGDYLLATKAVSYTHLDVYKRQDYDWVLNIREQCVKANITFWFKNTGSLFRRDGIVKKINPFKQTSMAKELGIDISDGKRLF